MRYLPVSAWWKDTVTQGLSEREDLSETEWTWLVLTLRMNRIDIYAGNSNFFDFKIIANND